MPLIRNNRTKPKMIHNSTAQPNKAAHNLKSLWTTILILNPNRNIIDQPWKVRSQKNSSAERTVIFNKTIIRIKLIIIKR